jgi:hypothetical protein
VESTQTRKVPTTDERRLTATEVETEAGILAYAAINGELVPGYFRFGSNRNAVPKPFRETPGETAVTLVYESGEVHTRRTLTETERSIIDRAVGFEANAQVVYDDADERLYVVSEKRGRFSIDLERGGRGSYLGRPVTPAIRSEAYSVSEGSDGEVSTQGDDCFDLFGPCPACVAGTVTCAACAVTCATGPQCAACLILTCGFTGGACGCCAICADGIPDPETAICPD